jgi:exodeoxyribonuclease VII small subunit
MVRKKTDGFVLEQALAELEQVVDSLEKGDLPLEQSLVAFEKGIALSRQCQASLKEVERKIQILTQNPKNGDVELQDFPHECDE